MKIKETVLISSITTIVFSLLFLISFYVVAMSGWNNPEYDPPQGNVSSPINIGSETQVKDGAFGASVIDAHHGEFNTIRADQFLGLDIGSAVFDISANMYTENCTASGGSNADCTVHCPEGSIRTGCSVDENSGNYRDWTVGARPTGSRGCYCRSTSSSITNAYVRCFAYCLDLEIEEVEALEVATLTATDIEDNRVRLRGRVTDFSGASSAMLWFEWGTSENNLTNQTSPTSVYDTNVFSETITGLDPGEIYYYRVVGESHVVSYGATSSLETYFSTTCSQGDWYWQTQDGSLGSLIDNCSDECDDDVGCIDCNPGDTKSCTESCSYGYCSGYENCVSDTKTNTGTRTCQSDFTWGSCSATVPDCPSSECSSDLDCPCYTDDDCSFGDVCDGGDCVECITDSDCGAGDRGPVCSSNGNCVECHDGDTRNREPCCAGDDLCYQEEVCVSRWYHWPRWEETDCDIDCQTCEHGCGEDFFGPTCNECSDDWDCPWDQVCHEGSCLYQT